MMVATFIDLDEKTIPDEITVPGMLLGLMLASLLPQSRLPVEQSVLEGHLEVVGLSITTPHAWPPWLHQTTGMVIGLACLAGWFYGILPKTWWTRSGPRKAMRYLIASILRDRGLPLRLALLVTGWSGIVVVWWLGATRWEALLSALVGVAFAGGLIWSIRVVAGHALGVEAMGFGDVTLMAMIGAYVGWQTSLIIFFLSPFAALLVALAQLIFTGRKDIAYGPYLCLSTAVVIVWWQPLWQRAAQYFWLGWLLPGMLLVCLVLMAGMLLFWGAVSRGLTARP
jgi:prepilin signal peptidase PulO-like enzyme (type II secretory pathway)